MEISQAGREKRLENDQWTNLAADRIPLHIAMLTYLRCSYTILMAGTKIQVDGVGKAIRVQRLK